MSLVKYSTWNKQDILGALCNINISQGKCKNKHPESNCHMNKMKVATEHDKEKSITKTC